ncbi:uncharacterized protein LOC133037767 isoform X1 [Cannabis sativa]|uniref:NERD domain-containing protein n=1 Tax=Cannabis sativa TaxID=3483 RepID=A0A7J6GBH2_CANSA|nr:uncharacterized protein LOC133037767 isoform X1 [Cannabis sativa]KAF4380305.1 hypothetical protein F8388_024598 [Cannabis sativa]
MWVEILCGLILYKVIKRFFYDDDILEVESSDSNALFSVSDRLEKLYGGKAYVGLRIPDADTGTRQNIDLVLLTKGGAVVVSVKNLAGFVLINADGSWSCETKNKTEHLPNPVEETRKQASILEAYLEQRGISLPEGYLSCKVILPNPKCCTIQAGSFPPEVITYDQWTQQKPETKTMFSGWLKGAFGGGKKEMQESIQQNLHFTLNTAPIWDRVELKGKYVLGEFLEFKGKQEDLHALRNIKRSKVSRLVTQKTSMLGFAHSTLQVLYSPRDYRSEGASASEWEEVCVRSSTEVVFQPQNSTKVRKFKLSSVISMTLSA